MPGFLAKQLVAAGVVLSAAAGMTSVAVGQTESTQVESAERDSVSTNAQAKQWVRQLGAEVYDERQEAQRELLSLGREAIPALFAALQNEDPEVVWRTGQLLEQIAVADGDPDNMRRICERMSNVSGSLREELAVAAKKLRDSWSERRSELAIQRLQSVGASVITGNDPFGGIPVNGGQWLQGNVQWAINDIDLNVQAAGQPFPVPVNVNDFGGPLGPPIFIDGDVPQMQIVEQQLPVLLPPAVPLLPEFEDVEFEFDVVELDGEPLGVDWEQPVEEPAVILEPPQGVVDAIAELFVPAEQEPQVDDLIELGANVAPAEAPANLAPVPAGLDPFADEPAIAQAPVAAEAAIPFEGVAPLLPADIENHLDQAAAAIAAPPGVVVDVDWGQQANIWGAGQPVMAPDLGLWIDVNPGAPVSVQRSIVIDENWRGTAEDFALLNRVRNLSGIQINGREIDDEMLATIESLTGLQWLSLNRSRVDFAGLRAVMRKRPQLSVQCAGTARMGVYGGENATGEPGCWVTNVIRGAPASDAGVKDGDLIVSIDGNQIADFSELALFVSLKLPGETVVVELQRGEERVEAEIVLEAREE